FLQPDGSFSERGAYFVSLLCTTLAHEIYAGMGPRSGLRFAQPARLCACHAPVIHGRQSGTDRHSRTLQGAAGMKRVLLVSLMGAALTLGGQAGAQDLSQLEQAARAEGRVDSVGMPDSWANWKDTWADLKRLYGLEHSDTDMSSAQEIAKFAAEKQNATADIGGVRAAGEETGAADVGDVGAAFGPIAVQQGVTQPYKPTTWEQIPDWAKDDDGHWMLAYTGSIAFIVNKQLVKDIPRSWADLKQGRY